MSTPNFRVVIPARFGSTRLPGKPLLPIAGRPMIEHVYRRAQESGANQFVIATDDPRIVAAVQGFGGEAIMTSAEHASGTDRLAEVAAKLGWDDQDIVVNLQGDEPLMQGKHVAAMAVALASHAEAAISTMAAPIVDPQDIVNPGVVKVVLDSRQLALYFSRAPIPWVRGDYEPGTAPQSIPTGTPVLKHFGLYGYRVQALRALASAPVAVLEAAESLEQLRALYMGMRIRVEVVDDNQSRGVDTQEDLDQVDALMRRRDEAQAR
jgi:3-deoxy-manno-octulosonate cytidylyltransferase (CMP-KDO synthetase)